MSTTTPIGQRIREAREAIGITQTRLAELSGITRGGLSLIESDTIQPAHNTLSRIAGALGMSVELVPLSSQKPKRKK